MLLGKLFNWIAIQTNEAITNFKSKQSRIGYSYFTLKSLQTQKSQKGHNLGHSYHTTQIGFPCSKVSGPVLDWEKKN